jgi:methyl-accepting chemotaxis protein
MLEAMASGGARVKEGQATFDAVVSDMEGIRACVGEVTDSIGAIAGMLTDQQHAANGMSANLAEIARLAAQNEEDARGAAKLIADTDALIGSMIDGAEAQGVRGFVERRLRADHMVWKRQLAECLAGVTRLDPKLYAARVEPLGAAFARVGDPGVLQSAEYRRIVALVEGLKRDAVRLVERTAAGDIGAAIEAYGAMDTASGEVMGLLKAVEERAAA